MDRTLLTPAEGAAAVTASAMNALLAEHLTATILTSQAKLLFPNPHQHDERVGCALEFRIKATAQAAAAMALAMARLPYRSRDALLSAPARRGALPGSAEPKLVAIVEHVIAGRREATQTTSLLDAYEEIEARLADEAMRLGAEHPDWLEAESAAEAEQYRKTDVRMPAGAAPETEPPFAARRPR